MRRRVGRGRRAEARLAECERIGHAPQLAELPLWEDRWTEQRKWAAEREHICWVRFLDALETHHDDLRYLRFLMNSYLAAVTLRERADRSLAAIREEMHSRLTFGVALHPVWLTQAGHEPPWHSYRDGRKRLDTNASND